MAKTRTISTFQGTNPAYSLIVAANHENPKVLNLDGYCNGTANTQYWLQCFDSATVPANGTVPLRSLMLLGADGFTFNKLDLGLDTESQDVPPNTGNLVFAISTTKDTLTIGTGTVSMSLNVDIEEYEIQAQPDSTVTDTGVLTKTIWTDANGPNLLTSLVVTNKEAGDRFVMLFATDSATAGAFPAAVWPIGTSGDSDETLRLNFGTAGLSIRSQTSSGTFSDGCFFVLSTTAPTYTAAVGAGADITAKYITL